MSTVVTAQKRRGQKTYTLSDKQGKKLNPDMPDYSKQEFFMKKNKAAAKLLNEFGTVKTKPTATTKTATKKK